MKLKKLSQIATVAIVLSLSVVGCRKGLEKTTLLPGRGTASVSPPGPLGPIGPSDGNRLPPEDISRPLAVNPPPQNLEKPVPLNAKLGEYVVSADQPFKSDTVYFEYDKSTIKSSDVSKVERVASGIKGLAGKALRIEGHCDERGTEEYNRSLGERRAFAVREALMRAGLDPNLVDTISFGEDRPADPGHNEAAWSKNRRGEFIVIEPPSAPTTSALNK